MVTDAAGFIKLLSPMLEAAAGLPVDTELERRMNQEFSAGDVMVKAVEDACHDGIAAGWMCDREQGGIRFGRVAKPSPETCGFSIDVVRYADLAGPHHSHPTGEIDLILPITPGARFDGRGAGWLVYPPGSAHRPTITGGEAIVLYLLPEGRIDFTR